MSERKKLLRRHSPGYNFAGIYENGITIRWGKTFEENPSCAPFPELVDISISNQCSKGCDFCYRNSTPDGRRMGLDTFRYVLQQLHSKEFGPVFQIAIGGGEPTEHPSIVQMLAETRKSGIIPNLTTNAETVSDQLLKAFKKYCGALAVSMSSINVKFLRNKVRRIVEAGIKTNIHFLLTKESMKQSIGIMEGKWDNEFGKINAIVFLTHKSIGRGHKKDNIVLNEQLRRFLALVDRRKTRMSVGFDACFVPLLLTQTHTDPRLLDSCECGYFSVFIDEDLNVKPCSFATRDDCSFSLKKNDLEYIWASKFDRYRSETKHLCNLECKYHDNCRGGCLFHPFLNLCRYTSES